tara:strand:+ start:304 stop:786 length:483 start_codon:yes stop_codon:yes gene_type:complete
MMDIYKEWGDDAYIWKEGTWMPLAKGYCKGYDGKWEKDKLYGRIGEEFTRQLIEDPVKIEIKTERAEYLEQLKKWPTTGNIAIEYRCNGKPSGISTTESEVWIHYLSLKGVILGGFIFKVDLLKAKIKKLHKEGNLRTTMGGDGNLSQMALLPIKELFDV